MEEVERLLHDAFHDLRTPGGEFFKIEPQRAKSALNLVLCKSVTPSGNTTNQRQTLQPKQRSALRFSFKKIGLEPGTTITSVFDSKLKAKVYDDTDILVKRKLAKLTDPKLWKYRGETLNERWKRIQKERNQKR